jgi:RNA-binding protein
MLDITADQRRALRARAHALNPVVAISQNGLSEAVLQEISTSLDSHELIKIRVFSDEREVREQYLASICEQLGAAPVQHIGKVLVIWRPGTEAKTTTARRSRNEPRRSKRSFQGGTRD